MKHFARVKGWKLHGAKITLCTVYIKIATEDNDLSVWKKKRERREGKWPIRERERQRQRPTSWSVVPFVAPSWPASSRSDTWPGIGSVSDTGGQSPSEHTEPAPSVHPYDGLKVYKINVRACVTVVWLMPKNIIINIDCGLVFNIKHEQWSTNTIYLSVL